MHRQKVSKHFQVFLPSRRTVEDQGSQAAQVSLDASANLFVHLASLCPPTLSLYVSSILFTPQQNEKIRTDSFGLLPSQSCFCQGTFQLTNTL